MIIETRVIRPLKGGDENWHFYDLDTLWILRAEKLAFFELIIKYDFGLSNRLVQCVKVKGLMRAIY